MTPFALILSLKLSECWKLQSSWQAPRLQDANARISDCKVRVLSNRIILHAVWADSNLCMVTRGRERRAQGDRSGFVKRG
ncbi:hypothetical protein M758_2G133300 [Ceratodon purpureus]|nr:hypothetical protein M758_2G133300 [Ceratodon purpureus]